MDWAELENRWETLGSRAQVRWDKLTDDDLVVVAGRRMKLIGRVQRRYRLSFRVAREQVDSWQAALATGDVSAPALAPAATDEPGAQ